MLLEEGCRRNRFSTSYRASRGSRATSRIRLIVWRWRQGQEASRFRCVILPTPGVEDLRAPAAHLSSPLIPAPSSKARRRRLFFPDGHVPGDGPRQHPGALGVVVAKRSASQNHGGHHHFDPSKSAAGGRRQAAGGGVRPGDRGGREFLDGFGGSGRGPGPPVTEN